MSDQNKPQTNIDPPLIEVLLAMVPLDGTTIGNTALKRALETKLTGAEGQVFSEDAYWQAHAALVTQGLLVKCQGRGGSVRRAAAPESHIGGDLADGADGFALQAEVAPAAVAQAVQVAPKPAGAAAPAPKHRSSAVDANDAAQILAYRHADKRVNNPEVGMVTPATDPEAGKNRWAYDPHLDPALQFDPQRARLEALIDDALASERPSDMREALQEMKRLQSPYLAWTGKAERTSFDVDSFIYKTVPHVTLKSIANNAEIDCIYERLHPNIEAALAELNAALASHLPSQPFVVTEGIRKGQAIPVGRVSPSGRNPTDTSAADTGKRRVTASPNPTYSDTEARASLFEWEVPFDLPTAWPAEIAPLFAAFHTARQKMQAEMDRSIAAQADNETLYDQPEKSKNKLRITGPFTVEAVPFPSVKSLIDASGPDQADASIARTGESGRQHQWRDELLKAGIRGKGGQMLKFADLEALPADAHIRNLHASGHLDTGERVVVSFGPEHAALEQRQVSNAMNDAGNLFPLPKMLVFCAFTFDPEAAKDIDSIRGITALKAQMNTDLLTEDLKKARTSNQSFWLMGQPEVEVRKTGKAGQWVVEVHGFDYFDTVKGELISGGKRNIAMWALDTDYDERSLFPRQVFFPMAGKGEGWEKLKKDIRAELDESLLQAFHGTVSLPFAAGDNRKVAVKFVDDRGIESLKVIILEG